MKTAFIRYSSKRWGWGGKKERGNKKIKNEGHFQDQTFNTNNTKILLILKRDIKKPN